MDPLEKNSQNIFAYSSVSEHSSLFLYFEKKLHFFSGAAAGESNPPSPWRTCPLRMQFFYVLPNDLNKLGQIPNVPILSLFLEPLNELYRYRPSKWI